jgi:hypothetical protein
MLRKYWTKWGLLLVGSAAALQWGTCVARFIMDNIVLRGVN